MSKERVWSSRHLKLHFFGSKAKRQILKRFFQENKARQIFPKTDISYPLIGTRTCVYQGVRNVRFSENLASSVFLKHLLWDSPFCLVSETFQNYAFFNTNNFTTIQRGIFWVRFHRSRVKLTPLPKRVSLYHELQ